MGEFSAIHWFVLTVILLLFGGRKIREMMRHLGNGPRGGPPTHPLPVTSTIETSRGSGNGEKEPGNSSFGLGVNANAG